MPLEIERKFLVVSDDYKISAKVVYIKQAYLSVDENMAIRVRIEKFRQLSILNQKNPNG